MTWMPGTLYLSETLLSLMLQTEEVSQHNLIMYISLLTQMVAAIAILHLLVCNAPVEPTTSLCRKSHSDLVIHVGGYPGKAG